jgi:hypothetical protein
VGEVAFEAPEALPVGAAVRKGWQGVGLDMPKRPFKGQARTDKEGKCEDSEVPINGGCWIALADMKPPCKSKAYEWTGRCYLPIYPAPPEPSSTLPRAPEVPARRAH